MSRLVWSLVLGFKLLALALWLIAGSGAVGLLIWATVDIFLLYNLFVPSGQGFGQVVTRFKTEKNEIWLTIDDGPCPEDTPRILDALDRHQAKATFFLIGERAEKYPELVVEILRRGHEVGHHTHTHPARTFWCAGPKRVRAELDRALDAFKRAGATPRYFRPPVGIKNFFLHRELVKRGLTCVGWSIRSYDSRADDPQRVVARVMSRIHPGAIVLMHEGGWLNGKVRVHAVELLVAACVARGLSCVFPDRE
jgi:peptidoglycan/xylan/chitin deacetylase (PgdA/CDA1 family)